MTAQDTDTDTKAGPKPDTDTDTDTKAGPKPDTDLGEAGQRALAAERSARKAAEAKAKAAEVDAAKYRESQQTEQQKAVATATATATEKVSADFRARLAAADLRAAAGGRLRDPSDAGRYVDLTGIEVTDDGLDPAAAKTAIDQLLKSRPYLAAEGARTAGHGDIGQGARGTGSKDTAALIRESEAKGDHTTAVALKLGLIYPT